MTEELKNKMKLGREKAKLEKESKFVSSDDFNSFKMSIVGILENISNKLNSTPKEEDRRVVMATAPERNANTNISQSPSNEEVVHNLDSIASEYQMNFDKYFDMDDGFKAMLKGVNFKIEVPLTLSNAQSAHKTFYGHDIRHKVLDGHDIQGSMENYCKMVAQNL